MPYAFAPRANQRTGQIRQLDVPLSDWMGLKFGQFGDESIFAKASRFTEDVVYDRPFGLEQDAANWKPSLMSPEVANRAFGIPGYLDFKEPISVQRARLMRERKDEELRRMAYFESATHSTLSLKAAMGLTAGMAGSIANPLDFSLMFAPFVGYGAKAGGVGRFAQAAARARASGSTLQRIADEGIFTSVDKLGQVTRYPRFGAAVINSAMGNAITEIPVFAQNVRDQAIYGVEDAALNILLGGATGGAFHLVGAGIGRLLGRAKDAYDRLDPETQDAMLKRAVNKAVSGEPIDAHKLAMVDPGTILRDVQFDEVAARQRALEAVGVLPEEARARAIIDGLNRKQAGPVDLLDLARQKAGTGKETIDGRVAAKLLDRFAKGERGVDLFRQMADLFELRYNPHAPTVQERLKGGMLDAYFGDLEDGVGAASKLKQARAELFDVQRAIQELDKVIAGTTDPVVKNRLTKFNMVNLQGKEARATATLKLAEDVFSKTGPPLRAEELEAHAAELATKAPEDFEARARAGQLQARAEQIRARRVQQFIAEERAKVQASLEGRLDAETTMRVREDIKNGRVLTDEQVEAMVKDPMDEAYRADLKESIATLEKELAVVEPDSPVAKFVAEQVAKAKEKGEADLRKAIDIAAECLIRNL